MDDAFHAAASAMSASVKMLEVGARNTVNARTPGYQSRLLATNSFETTLDLELDRDAALVKSEAKVGFRQGMLVQSDQPLSLGLKGPGFLAIETPGGEAYTRNGDLMLDASGKLVTRAGYPVLSEGGQIQASTTAGPVRLLADGSVVQGKTTLGKLRVVEFSNRQALQPVADTIFQAPREAGMTAADETQIAPGYLELPPQSTVTGMVAMIAANHQFESAQRTMTVVNDTYRRLNRPN